MGEVAPIVLSTVSFFLFHYRQGLEELALNRFQGSNYARLDFSIFHRSVSHLML
ncbi:conserved hypothetical protein [Bifidobacterium longum subsp. infantis ATCC 15697 = JCM 1222 = DSM 20088]|nr:conserved hypothetical protein [Bifidobacterium longum subsp. infantis ATCC 15697 = JCM 1222 = DSM 20088]